MANPTLLTSPIAENGDKNVIPTSTGATTGLLDQEHGFQQINELPLQAGGLPPQRKDFNGAFNLLSKILFYAQKGWQFEFDESQDYYAGCVVKDIDGYMYECIADVSASSTHPQNDTTNWQKHDISQYLPLDGGTMTGQLRFENTYPNKITSILGTETDSIMEFMLGTDRYHTPSIQFQGKDIDASGTNPGSIVMRGASPDATDNTPYLILKSATRDLVWSPSGLQTGEHNLGGSAIVASSITATAGYIKLASGLIVQWDQFACSSSGTSTTFPISFGTTPAGIVAQAYNTSGSQQLVWFTNITATGFTAKVQTGTSTVNWIAICK